MTQEELLELRREAEQELMQNYPGVVGVAVGFKVRGGQITDEVVLRVYVEEKKPVSALRPEEIIPPTYKGAATDVLTVPRTVHDVDATPCADRAQHSPLVGGITLSTLKTMSGGGVGLGTLGFFVTLNGETAPHNIGLVSNNHVFTEAGGAVGDTIYQPAWATQADGTLLPRIDGSPVGTIFRLPPKADDASGSFVDAAAVKLNICISSWCNTNCGVSFANEIAGLNINGSNAIADINTSPKVGDTVIKVGRTTGRTVGRITAIALPLNEGGTQVHNNIEIQAMSMQTADNCGGVLRFGDSGDSGSALIDAQGKLVGLYHGHDPAHPNLSHASHIQPVLTALNAVAITLANPVHGNPAASGMLADVPAMIDGRPNMTPQLRERFLATDEGRRLFALVEQHRHEVVHLVNHNRRVTVAWHRGQGPAFLNRCIANARDPEIRIPDEIGGVTREVLVRTMARSLADHGSPVLRAVIERHLEDVVAYAGEFDSLHDVVERLGRRQSA